MKRNSLATATLAGLMGAAGLAMTAQAVNLNPDGLGQVLIYPYYTVNKNNSTAISVVNTTSRVKAVKVRFLEGANSKEVLDFNLYMSPFDVWTAAVFATDGATGTGPGNFRTTDTSCLVPDIRNITQPFLPFAYTGAFRDFPTGSANADFLGSLTRTREGHIEMIEMGEVRTGTGLTNLAEEATHANGVPVNCAALVTSWTPGSGGWSSTPAAIDGPTGGLFGAGFIIDVGNGTMHSYAAEAIAGFYTVGDGALHSNPGSVLPDLRQARTGGTAAAPTADSFVFVGGGAQIQQETFLSGTAQPPNAVSLVFMHDAIYNEYNTETALGASSEWVITFPTKRYYVDVLTDALVTPPFTEAFRDDGSACETFGLNYYDREERTPGIIVGGPIISPPPPDPTITLPSLCWESNVFTFNQPAVAASTSLATRSSGIFGSRFSTNITTAATGGTTVYQAGWARMGFDNDDTAPAGQDHVLTAPSGRRYVGLPTIGFWSVNFVNSAAQPGRLSNYSGSIRHRGSRLVLAPIVP